jgi:hypothetical protein
MCTAKTKYTTFSLLPHLQWAPLLTPDRQLLAGEAQIYPAFAAATMEPAQLHPMGAM